VIALDLRGHGRSDKPFDQHYEHRAQAELVRDAIRKLRLRKVTLVGHSYGGAVALVAALQANARRERQIRRLVVLNAPVYPQKLSFAVRFLQKPVVPYVALSVVPPHVPVSLALMAEAIGMPHITETDIDVYARPFFDAGANHALIVTARNIVPRNAQDLIAHYPTIRQPTLVIWCRKDQVVPLASGQRLVKDLPRAQLEVLDRCDHASPEQRPKSIARLIRRFSRR
ncbi:MAG: alpha/beta fold hydrolase, partial [Pseudomonadota bacterium]